MIIYDHLNKDKGVQREKETKHKNKDTHNKSDK